MAKTKEIYKIYKKDNFIGIANEVKFFKSGKFEGHLREVKYQGLILRRYSKSYSDSFNYLTEWNRIDLNEKNSKYNIVKRRALATVYKKNPLLVGKILKKSSKLM